MHYRLLAVVFAACLTAGLAHAQAPQPSADADGLMHVELTLQAQNVSVAYPPDLSSEAAEHRALLSGTVGSRVRVGTLEAHRALRIGSLAPDLSPPPEPDADDDDDSPAPPAADDDADADADERPSTPSYELWLVRNSQGWELEAHAEMTDDADDDDMDDDVSIIPLSHRATDTASTSFTVSVHATGTEAGRLTLRWGRHVWSTDLRFDELPSTPRRPRVSGLGRAREVDTDTTAFARGVTLSEGNETALVLPDGSRVAVLYWRGIDIEDEDYEHLPMTADGAVVRLIHAAPLRLKTDVPLRFGQTEVPTGNVAPGYAGAYAVWLRKAGDGWHFVFNDEPDSWGTQHNPSTDRVEIDAAYERGNGSFRPLAVTLVPTGTDSGELVVHWGPHEWTADFTISRGP